jgi:hypothetical protein
VRLSVGKDPADASARRQRKEAELNAVNNGVSVVPENEHNGHRSVAAAVTDFLDETKRRLTVANSKYLSVIKSLECFSGSCGKV